MLYEFNIKTPHEDFINITTMVQNAVDRSGTSDGMCIIYCPHTTAGITINENSDPDVIHDMLLGLCKAFPDRNEFRHFEGNSSAHLKASCMGTQKAVIINNSRLLLGVWQAIYFCEFDGPRSRKFYVNIIQQ